MLETTTKNHKTIGTHDREWSSESERRPQQYSKKDDVLSSVPVAKVSEERREYHVAGDEGRLQQTRLRIVNWLVVTVNVKSIPFDVL